MYFCQCIHATPLSLTLFFQPVGIYPKKYEWAARPLSGSSNGILHQDLHPPPPPPMQIGGDCSLWIRSATLDFDDGLWECQVTASDFTAQDALTSQPVRLVVRGKCVGLETPRLVLANLPTLRMINFSAAGTHSNW